MAELRGLIEEARGLLGWPTTQKLAKLANEYPSERVWNYAITRLKRADHPNEKYLIACLDTALKDKAARSGGVNITTPVWFCYRCGYAVEYCSVTAGWRQCPLCSRKGIEAKLIYIDRSKPDWGRW